MSARQQKRRKAPDAQVKPAPSLSPAFLERHCRALVLGLVLLASARIVATYTVFNHTFDEPAHIACGMEWLANGTYRYETQHPPLARVASALGPFLLGIRMQGTPPGTTPAPFIEGNAILYRNHQYDLTLALSRLGVLPFFWIACLVVYWWAKRCFGPAVAVLSLFLFSFLPPVLAHAGLSTTDMALTAFLGAAFLCGWIWSEEPTWQHAALFGASTGLAVISKFSVLVFFPAVVVFALAWYFVSERPPLAVTTRAVRERIPSFGLAVLTGFVLIWAGYRFSIGGTGLADLFSGIRTVMQHNAEGHPAYLLGQRSKSGFWYFFPVALAVKTPLAFLLLLGAGVFFLRRPIAGQRLAWLPLAFASAIVLVSLFSHINIGVRHILPVYIGFSIVGAVAILRLLELGGAQPWMRAGLALVLLWFAGSSLLSHPDYLAYFNELAGDQPEKILVESDLDWGQDMKRLAKRLNEAGARVVTFSPFLVADFEAEFGFPPILEMDVQKPSPGWNAVSLSLWKARRLGLYENRPEVQLWPDRVKRQERIGKSTLLWYFQEAAK